MGTEDLPELPTLHLPIKGLLPKLVLGLVVQKTGSTSKVGIPQRAISAYFNRSSRDFITTTMRVLSEHQYIQVTEHSTGVQPNLYSRGPIFGLDNLQTKRILTFAESIFGPAGLLDGWSYRSAWGHGCLDETGVLYLATLKRIGGPVVLRDLYTYLSPLMSRKTMDRKVQCLLKEGVVTQSRNTVLLVSNWETSLRLYLDRNPCCNDRKESGDRKRAVESFKNAERVSHGIITDAERQRFRTLKCVKCGSRRPSQLEHFPPRKFLRGKPFENSKLVLWSICPECNDKTKAFIRSLPSIEPLPVEVVYSSKTLDPLRKYRITANLNLQRFYSAYARNDKVAAIKAIQSALSHLEALPEVDWLTLTVQPVPHPLPIRQQGRKPRDTTSSQLPLTRRPLPHYSYKSI